MKMTVSELKQLWWVLLQIKKSAIFGAETAIIRTENIWSLLKLIEHRLTLIKISENVSEPLNIYESLG